MLKLRSELASLLVIRDWEISDIPTLVDLDLRLYTEEAGTSFISDRMLPEMLRLMSICLMAISNDFLDSDRPNPELSWEESFLEVLLGLEMGSSRFGGASFLIFTTLSTIWVPIKTGFTSSLVLEYLRLFNITGLPLFWELPLETCAFDDKYGFCLGFSLETATAEDGWELGADGLSLDVEDCLLDDVDLKFGKASVEKPGASEDFCGLELAAGEIARDGTVFLMVVALDFVSEEERPAGADELDTLDWSDDWHRVAHLDADLEDASIDGLPVGVDERALDFVGVEDLLGGATILLEGTDAVLEEGVEDLKGFTDAGNVGRPVGVAGLATDPPPPDDDDLLGPALADLLCLHEVTSLDADSKEGSASLDLGAVGWDLAFPVAFITPFSNGVHGSVRSQS